MPNEEGISKAEAAGVGEGEAAGDGSINASVASVGRGMVVHLRKPRTIGSGRKLHLLFVDMHRRAISIGAVVITTITSFVRTG